MIIFSIQFHVNASMKNLLEGPLKLVYFLHRFLRKLTLGHSRSLEMNLKPLIVHATNAGNVPVSTMYFRASLMFVRSF